MGCGASAKYVETEKKTSAKSSQAKAITQGQRQTHKLHGQAWILESRRLIETLVKLEEILEDLLAAEGVDSARLPGSPKGDRKLALQLLREDATVERLRLERRLQEDPSGEDPIDLPELAASLLRTLRPLVAAQAEARGVTMPPSRQPRTMLAPRQPQSSAEPALGDSALPPDLLSRDALMLLSEQVESLAVVTRPGGSQELMAVDIQAGCSVQISGLHNAPELNGCIGIAEKFDAAASRWTVRLANGDAKRVRQGNLQAA